MRTLRTRIAPTPSGHLHRGNAFAFLATYLWAQVNEASLMLRIDDLDQPRYRRRYAESIFRVLENLGIEWQEGPQSIAELEGKWSQKYRHEKYQHFLENLRLKGALFACTCSRQDLIAGPEGYHYPGTCLRRGLAFRQKDTAWRYCGAAEALLHPFNESGNPAQKVSLPPTLQHMVLRRKYGLPAYQVASLCDDEHFGITHIVRGMDLWPSSIAQLCLSANAGSGFGQTQFWHHGLIAQKNGTKLSKSQKAAPVNEELYSQAGRSAFYGNFCDWMGWPQKLASTKALLKALQNREVYIKTQ